MARTLTRKKLAIVVLLLLVDRSRASSLQYGVGPASCSANVGCQHLTGDCCPTSYTGTFLSCCPHEDTLASCSAHAGCAGLTGDCCPSANGQDLYCCYQNRQSQYRREFTFYGHPTNKQNHRASYLSSTGRHEEYLLSNGQRRYTYERSPKFQFDLIYFQTNHITNANDYVSGSKKLYLTIESTSNDVGSCTEILIQLDSLPTAKYDNYPTGRHSRYLGLYTPGSSERVEFTFLDRPDPNVPDTAVNAIAVFFRPGTYTQGTFQYSFLDSMVACTATGASLPVDAAPYPSPVYVAPTKVYPAYPPPPTPVYVAPPPPSPVYVAPPSPVYVAPPPPSPVYVAPPPPSPVYVAPPPPSPVYMAPPPIPVYYAPVQAPVRAAPVPVPVPIPDDPVNRPVPVPVPLPDDPVSRPIGSMPGRNRQLFHSDIDQEYINYRPFDAAVPATKTHGNERQPQNNDNEDMHRAQVNDKRQLSYDDEYDECSPPPVNQCPAQYVGAVCTGLNDETCQNPECANTEGCSGGMVSSYLALEHRSTESIENSSAVVASTCLMLLGLIGIAGMHL